MAQLEAARVRLELELSQEKQDCDAHVQVLQSQLEEARRSGRAERGEYERKLAQAQEDLLEAESRLQSAEGEWKRERSRLEGKVVRIEEDKAVLISSTVEMEADSKLSLVRSLDEQQEMEKQLKEEQKEVRDAELRKGAHRTTMSVVVGGLVAMGMLAL